MAGSKFLVVLALISLVQDPKTPPPAPKAPVLVKLVLGYEGRRLNPGSVMPVRFTIENISGKDIELDEPADYLDGVEVRDGGGRIIKPFGTSVDKKRTLRMEKGGFIGGTIDLQPALRLKDFQEGRFKISWKWGGVTSNEIEPWVIKDWEATIETNFGDAKVEFYPDTAPNHVLNFLKLCRDKTYEGQKIYKIIPNFLIQGGRGHVKPTDGKIRAELSERKHQFGTLSMFHGPDIHGATTEFMICLGEAPGLDRAYSIFGQLIDGEKVLREIGAVKTDHTPCPKCGAELKAEYVAACCGTHHRDEPTVEVTIKRIRVAEQERK